MSSKLLIGSLALLLAASPAPACSRVFWNTDARLVGRNMDWPEDTMAKLWFFPAGMTRNGLTGSNSLRPWRSLYASVAISFFDKGTTDGMNDQGLVVNALWLDEADYGARKPEVPGLSISLWTQYLLDNFATVEAVVKASKPAPGERPTFQIVPFKLNGKELKVHIAVADPTRDSAIIEYINGEVNIYHDGKYKVMTNSPPLPAQWKNKQCYQPFGGAIPLPGSTQSLDRFVRASYAVDQLPKPASANEAVAEIASVMRNVAQPISATSEHLYNSRTRWMSIADPGDRRFEPVYRRFFVQMATSPYMVWADLNALIEGSKGRTNEAMFDLTAHQDVAGDVTGWLRSDHGHTLHFEPALPEKPVSAAK